MKNDFQYATGKPKKFRFSENADRAARAAREARAKSELATGVAVSVPQQDRVAAYS